MARPLNRASTCPVSEEMQGSAREKRMSLSVIFDTCEPRDEVLRGDLRDEMFAAAAYGGAGDADEEAEEEDDDEE